MINKQTLRFNRRVIIFILSFDFRDRLPTELFKSRPVIVTLQFVPRTYALRRNFRVAESDPQSKLVHRSLPSFSVNRPGKVNHNFTSRYFYLLFVFSLTK